MNTYQTILVFIPLILLTVLGIYLHKKYSDNILPNNIFMAVSYIILLIFLFVSWIMVIYYTFIMCFDYLGTL